MNFAKDLKLIQQNQVVELFLILKCHSLGQNKGLPCTGELASTAYNSACDRGIVEEGAADGDQYLTTLPEGWVMVTDLSTPSMIAWYCVSQSMPKMTSTSIGFRTMKEVGNIRDPTLIMFP